jgi:thymidylate kinase
MIIAIEGGDASGKKTQSQTLAKYYGDEGTCLSFPRYDGPFGDLILRSLKRESVMYRRRPSEDDSGAPT